MQDAVGLVTVPQITSEVESSSVVQEIVPEVEVELESTFDMTGPVVSATVT